MIRGILFVLESFRRHMDNGRWLFQQGMEAAGYLSAGHGLPSPGVNSTDVSGVVSVFDPPIVIFWPRYEWDHREWVGPPPLPPEVKFHGWECLLGRPDILRVLVLHDAASALGQQQRWAQVFRPHVYLIWYHAKSVGMYWPKVPSDQLVRTYHVVDECDRLEFTDRDGVCLFSGATNHQVYPMRTRLWVARENGQLPDCDVFPHCGYTQTGTRSPEYLRKLAEYRVALCSASCYKFALRKIFEATAAGCRVITDLPEYDYLPEIDANLTRVQPTISLQAFNDLVRHLYDTWNPEEQRRFSIAAYERYGHFAETARLAQILDACRVSVVGPEKQRAS